MAELPPSRYKIVEKDGRLIVYDNGVVVSSGTSKPAPAKQQPAAPIVASWAASFKGSPAAPDSPSARFGRLADRVAAALARRKNADGTIVVSRTKKEGLRSRTMEATLTAEQARIYGISMLSFIPLVTGIVLLFISSGFIGVPVLVLGLPPAAIGAVRLGMLFDKLEWRELGG